jgi:hypothetical protein
VTDRETAQQVLALPVEYGEGATVRDYLAELFAAFWEGRASDKYGMTGESDWRYQLYEPLRDAGLIPGWVDGYGVGYRTETDRHIEDEKLADSLIAAAIAEMARRPNEDGGAS